MSYGATSKASLTQNHSMQQRSFQNSFLRQKIDHVSDFIEKGDM